jgi:hypothetical protein
MTLGVPIDLILGRRARHPDRLDAGLEKQTGGFLFGPRQHVVIDAGVIVDMYVKAALASFSFRFQ